jgi:hypothetical protein
MQHSKMRSLSRRFVLSGLALTFVFMASAHGNVFASQASEVATCQTAGLTLQGYAYSNGWLLCQNGDSNTGGQQLYQETPLGSGNFIFVKGTGGAYTPDSLVALGGVDASDATILIDTIYAGQGTRSTEPYMREPI